MNNINIEIKILKKLANKDKVFIDDKCLRFVKDKNYYNNLRYKGYIVERDAKSVVGLHLEFSSYKITDSGKQFLQNHEDKKISFWIPLVISVVLCVLGIIIPLLIKLN